MGTTSEKLARLDETKTLLKQRLTEKGVDVASENNFYNLADKVGEIEQGTQIQTVTLKIGRPYTNHTLSLTIFRNGKIENVQYLEWGSLQYGQYFEVEVVKDTIISDRYGSGPEDKQGITVISEVRTGTYGLITYLADQPGSLGYQFINKIPVPF